MFKKFSLFAVLATALFLTGCAADKSGDAMTEDKGGEAMVIEKAEIPEVVKIGFIAPLTGNAGALGQDDKAGVVRYFELNPTIDGKTVEVIYEDGKCNGQDAANAAQKLVNVDKVQVIIGGLCSGETLASAPIAEQNRVLLLSPTSSSPAVTTAGDYIFRNYPSDDQVAKTMVDFILANHEKVSLITEQSDYAQGYRQAINKHMEAAGKADMLVLDEAFSADNTDFRTLLAKVQENGSDALIVIPQAPVTGGFAVKQAAELGIEIQIYSGDALVGPDFFDTAKDAAEGVRVVMASVDKSRAGYTELEPQLAETSNEAIFLFGYDAAQLVAEGIAEVGYNGTNLKQHFYNLEPWSGVASDVSFDENGDNNAPSSVIVAKDGKFVPFTE